MTKKVILGILAGFVSGLFATGGGMILVPAFIYFLNMEDKKARGTSTLCILVMVITSGFFYYKNDYINWNVGILCALGGMIPRFFGSKGIKKCSRKNFKINVPWISNICSYTNVDIGGKIVRSFNRISFWYYNRNWNGRRYNINYFTYTV